MTAPANTRHADERGQALLPALLFLAVGCAALLLAFGSLQLTSAKIQLQNTADASAYAAALLQARDYNFSAYTNRAMIANQAAVAQMVGLKSFVQHARRARRGKLAADHDLDEGVHAFSVIAEGPNGEMLGPSNIYVIEIEDAWYRLDTLFDPPLTDDAATEAAMHATARDVPPDRHVADAASAAHEAPALAVEPAKSAQRHGEDVPDVDRTGSQAPAEAFRPAMQVSPHEHEVAAGGEPAWLAASCQADRTDGLKLSLSDLLQDGAPDLFPADGSLEKTAASTDAGAPDLPGLKGDISDARTSSDAAPAGVAHLAYDDGMPLLDWSVSHGIDVHST
ncbi:hypothetical protein ACNSZF_02265 [Burkholderia gladioli]